MQRGFEAGIAHTRQKGSVNLEVSHQGRFQPGQQWETPESCHYYDSSASSEGSEGSVSMEEGQIDQELREEEGLTPDQLVFKGLFSSHLFKALLFKAESSTHLGVNTSREDNVVGEQDPPGLLFLSH